MPIKMMLPQGMTMYARLCGWTLARGTPAPGPRRPGRCPRRLGRFDQAIADFAETYADQNELDYTRAPGRGEK